MRYGLLLGIDDAGLLLEGKARLLSMPPSAAKPRPSVGEDHERLLALLAVAYRQPISADVLRHVEAASAFWERGEKALANLRLLYAGLPRVDDPTIVPRVRLAAYCLDSGMTPTALMKELGIEGVPFRKFDSNQPRVPAQSGRESGRWLSFSGSALSFLARTAPQIIAALARFASRFSVPTAVLGALFIPDSNSGGVTSGTLPGAPDISFEKDDPAGRLRLSKAGADGSTVEIETQLRESLYVDVASGVPIGRDLDGQLYLDFDAVRQVIADAQTQSARGDPDDEPKAATDEPKLCPAPTPDQPHGANQPAIAYENQVHERVNPLAPLSQGLAVKAVDPLTGKEVNFDDCYRYHGDLIDGDMRPGDLADAKGPTYGFLFGQSWSTAMDQLVAAATIQLRTADARGVGLKWYFAESNAAYQVRNVFSRSNLRRIVIGYMPPR